MGDYADVWICDEHESHTKKGRTIKFWHGACPYCTIKILKEKLRKIREVLGESNEN